MEPVSMTAAVTALGAALPSASTVAAGAGVASTGLSLIGGLMQAQGQEDEGAARAQTALYRSQIASNNATIEQQNRTYALQRGEILADEQRVRTRGVLGAQRAAMGASGADLSGGSTGDVLASTAETGELDALMIMHNAAMQARDSELRGANYQREAGLEIMSARNARRAGSRQATASLIGTAASVSDRWARYRSSGVV